MKNDLFEKKSGQSVDEKQNSSLKKNQPPHLNEIEEETGLFRTFFKYLLIIGSCILIPLFITNDNFIPDWLADARSLFVNKSENTTASTFSSTPSQTVFSVPPVPPVPAIANFPDNAKMGEDISKRVKITLERAGLATKISKEAQQKMDEALANVNFNSNFDEEKLEKAIENALASIDDKSLNATIESSIAAAFKSIEALNLGKNEKGFSSKPAKLSSSYIDYLAEMKKLGFTDTFENYELKSFYDNGISVDVLQDWKNYGWINQFEFYELISLYNNKITPSQLKPWIDAGYTKKYEVHEIISFINNNVSFDYLKLFADADLLKKFEFWEIVSFKNNNITPEILKPWLDSNYANKYESHELVSFITNKIPISFLDELQKKGILDDLEFWEITNLYKER